MGELRTADADGRGGVHEHICFAYDDVADFRARAREFLADGLARGLRVWYVAEDDGLPVRGLGDGHPGALQVHRLSSTYPTDTVVDGPAQAQDYAAETADALAAGYAGLRVAAEVTPLVRSPAQFDAFARYEHLADRLSAEQPFSAMCALDRAELEPADVARLACLHPRSEPATATSFRLHAAVGVTAALSGEVDLADREQFADALDHADLGAGTDGAEIVLDGTALRFVDHRSLVALSELAERRATTVLLHTRLRTAQRLVEVLDIPNVRVQVTA